MEFGTDGKNGTLEIVKRYEKDISTIVIEADDGVYDARNKEIDLKTGTFYYMEQVVGERQS